MLYVCPCAADGATPSKVPGQVDISGGRHGGGHEIWGEQAASTVITQTFMASKASKRFNFESLAAP